MATLAKWQDRIFIHQTYGINYRADFDTNAVGIGGGGQNDAILAVLASSDVGYTLPTPFQRNNKDVNLSSFHVDETIDGQFNPVALSIPTLADPYNLIMATSRDRVDGNYKILLTS